MARQQNRACIYSKIDPSCILNYAFTVGDHKENTLLTKSRNNNLLMWLANNFKRGNVRFTDMRVKVKAEQALKLIL